MEWRWIEPVRQVLYALDGKSETKATQALWSPEDYEWVSYIRHWVIYIDGWQVLLWSGCSYSLVFPSWNETVYNFLKKILQVPTVKRLGIFTDTFDF